MIHRRSFITGVVSLVAAPAIVRVGSIMPVRVMEVGLVEDVFLASLFRTLNEHPNMTATQILEISNIGSWTR